MAGVSPEQAAGRLPEVVTTLEQIEAPTEIGGDWDALLGGLRRLTEETGALDLGTPEGRQAFADAETRINQELSQAQTAVSEYVVANCELPAASRTG